MSLNLFREILSRRDPHGYYVIPAEDEAKSLVLMQGVIIVDVGDGILVKTRSRSQALKILKMLYKRNLLKMDEVEERI